MAISCITNHKLFDKFISNKTKITPKLSDDWELSQDRGGMGSLESVNLYSKKLNQNVFDISFSHFLSFIKEHDVEMKGSKIFGDFIIGTDRRLYAKSQWIKLQDVINRNSADIIPKNMWVQGNCYRTECGSEVKYLGKSHVISANQRGSNLVSKLQHYYCDIERYNNGDKHIYMYTIPASMKFIKVIEESNEPHNEINRIFKHELAKSVVSRSILGFNDTKINNPVLCFDLDGKYKNNYWKYSDNYALCNGHNGWRNHNRFRLVDLQTKTYKDINTFGGITPSATSYWNNTNDNREEIKNKFTNFVYITESV